MPDSEGILTPEELISRWHKEPGLTFNSKIITDLQNRKQVNWDNIKYEDFNGNDFKYLDFKGVREIPEKEEQSVNYPGDLRGIQITRKDIPKANLFRCHLQWAKLYDSNLQGVDLRNANLQNAMVLGANLKNANLINADLKGTDLRGAVLDGANLTNAQFRLKSFWWRIKHLFFKSNPQLNNNPTDITGAELKKVKLESDPVLYRELLDEQWLDRFAEKHKILYPFWLLTSNCGRWTFLIFVWAFVIAIIFGFIFSHSRFIYFGNVISHEWWHPFYLSFVTMTILGMASVEPVTTAAAVLHTIENIVGYALLGYAIAVFGSKFTRRSA